MYTEISHFLLLHAIFIAIFLALSYITRSRIILGPLFTLTPPTVPPSSASSALLRRPNLKILTWDGNKLRSSEGRVPPLYRQGALPDPNCRSRHVSCLLSKRKTLVAGCSTLNGTSQASPHFVLPRSFSPSALSSRRVPSDKAEERLRPLAPAQNGTYEQAGTEIKREVRLATPCLTAIFFLILTSCFFGTISNYVCSDFSIYNILTNSTADVPLFYKISATWSNHEGSLLLWCWLLSFNTFLFCISIATQFVQASRPGPGSLLLAYGQQSIVTREACPYGALRRFAAQSALQMYKNTVAGRSRRSPRGCCPTRRDNLLAFAPSLRPARALAQQSAPCAGPPQQSAPHLAKTAAAADPLAPYGCCSFRRPLLLALPPRGPLPVQGEDPCPHGPWLHTRLASVIGLLGLKRKRRGLYCDRNFITTNSSQESFSSVGFYRSTTLGATAYAVPPFCRAALLKEQQNLTKPNGGPAVLILIFFTTFCVATSNPFLRTSIPSINSLAELNPILQDPVLAIHPPCIYAGYVASAIAFSLCMSSFQIHPRGASAH